jgi:predicted TIM-barrel fold metal-dependent hydrolase
MRTASAALAIALAGAGAIAGGLGACASPVAPSRADAAPSPPPSTSPRVDAAVSAAPAVPPPPAPSLPPFTPSDVPRIDVHTHIEGGALRRAQELLGRQHIRHLVNLSGGTPDGSLAALIAEARALGHTSVFTNPDFRELRRGPGYGARMAEKLARAKTMGAVGVKIAKGLGLGYTDAAGNLLPVDDKGLDPLFEAAGKLGLPIAIHTGDPQAFWRPPTPDNERYAELGAHPAWSFYGFPVSWEGLYAQFERRVARHPKATFIGVHFGNAPEEPARVAKMLEKYKNLMIDTAARIPEIGRVDARHDAARMRAFFLRYQDRILFGTDSGVGTGAEDLMWGSTSDTPPTEADYQRFFDSTWRWFETDTKGLPSPTSIQGNWTIDGVALPRPVLEKVYWRNAARLLGLDAREFDARTP